MRKIWLALLLTPLFFLCMPTFAAEFELNKDYTLVAKPEPQTDKTKITVVEFFSYGCPACYAVEPALGIWLITKPKNVEFDRVPVIFHPEWYPYAKAYYVAKNFHVANRITPALFTAIQKNHENLTTKEALAALFQKQGIKANDFMGNYEFSPAIDGQVSRGDALMRQYGIVQIPTFVINGTEETNMALAKGDAKRLMQIIDFLITKHQTTAPAAKTIPLTKKK